MRYCIVFLFLTLGFSAFSWGFHAHRLINRHAVYTLPSPLIGFYKTHIEYITEQSVNPDRRRYAVKGEAPRHYLDWDHYGTFPFDSFPRVWSDADSMYGQDTLLTYGILPWNILWLMDDLAQAFEQGNRDLILRLSADLGHYVADAFVPLHTTENYNGQLSNQHGIHAFWESRVPEVFSQNYSYWVGSAGEIENWFTWVWNAVLDSHSKVDSVLGVEQNIRASYPEGKMYAAETRGTSSVRTWSRSYSDLYNKELQNMPERRIRLATKAVGSVWYSCYIRAGKPKLPDFESGSKPIPEKDHPADPSIKTRTHAEDGFAH